MAADTWRGWTAVAAALLLVLSATQARAKSHKPNAPAAPVPVAHIPVAPLGFLPPNPAYLNLRPAWASLNFIDDSHLLFTFHQMGLLKRIPGDPATDNDQEIQANVIDIATGKVVREAHWRMHDWGRYLWPLSDGKFLIRVRNSLYLTNKTLMLKPYLAFDTTLEAVEVSPNGGMLLVEVEKKLPPSKNKENAAPSLLSPTGVVMQTETELTLLHPGEHTALANGETRNPVMLPLVEDGYLSAQQGLSPNQWVISEKRVGQSKGTETKIGTVQSACPPKLESLGGNAVLVEDCFPNGRPGKPVTVLRLDGSVLWREVWQPKYIWPMIMTDQSGSRFAFESLEMDRPIGAIDAFGEADVVAQPVGVFDTETDKMELLVNASPVLSEEQNFALSPDGRLLAVLRDGAIEVYDLPAAGKQITTTAGNTPSR